MNEEKWSIKGVLCDIAGTLEFREKAIEGAIQVVEQIQNSGLKLALLTNIDSKPPKKVHQNLIDLGFKVDLGQIFTPIRAVKIYLEQFPHKKVHFITTKEVREEFSDFNIVGENEIPDIVVLSDFSDDLDIRHLNLAFRYAVQGSQLLGTQ